MPFRVKDNDWAITVNKALEGVENRQIEVSKETDTTGLGTLYRLFIQYLTHKQIQNGQPYMVQLGQVYHVEGVYYFKTEGITDFLRFEKFSLGRIDLSDQLTQYGCSEGELTYKNQKGIEKTIKCWKKLEDEELLAMDAFYEDVYEADTDIIQKIKLRKEQEGDTHGEDTKF